MKLSVIIIAKNEEKMIKDCLESVRQLADEIIYIDTGSTDKTSQIAKQYATKSINLPFKGLAYSQWRNRGLREAKGEWILYVDADERITPELRKEIQETMPNTQYTAFAIPRRNFLLGKELRWGGWWPGYVKRLYKRDKLKRWRGELHEEPVFEGELGHLKEPMIHLQPKSIEPMLEKSIRWSKIEAKLLHEANHPPVTWWRILRMGATTLFDRLIKKQGFRDGTEGWIESIYQAFHTMIIYMQLWEMQVKKEK
ncbi:glycosyltransferase family 2 protein [Patescibacteria group bacterium]|nr:glycosyltransferase family 2 protein [Patescibacteria group bacterium]